MTPIKSSTTCRNGFFTPGQKSVSFWFPRRLRGPAICHSIVGKISLLFSAPKSTILSWTSVKHNTGLSF